MLAKYVTVGDMQTSQAALRLKKKKKKNSPTPSYSAQEHLSECCLLWQEKNVFASHML